MHDGDRFAILLVDHDRSVHTTADCECELQIRETFRQLTPYASRAPEYGIAARTPRSERPLCASMSSLRLTWQLRIANDPAIRPSVGHLIRVPRRSVRHWLRRIDQLLHQVLSRRSNDRDVISSPPKIAGMEVGRIGAKNVAADRADLPTSASPSCKRNSGATRCHQSTASSTLSSQTDSARPK